MKQIDIKDMLQYLERQLGRIDLFIRNRYDKDSVKEQHGLFDMFESDYHEISLDRKYVLEMFDDVKKKVSEIKHDVEQCGVHFEDFSKANSDLHEYCVRNREQIERDTEAFGLYQHRLFEQIKKNVDSKMVNSFNDVFTEIAVDKYFHNYKRKSGGNTKKSTLFDAIYCEITNFPLNRLNDGYDDKGHFLGINNIPYDTSMVTRNSINCDTDGNPIFVFQYKRNSKGYFECIRVRFDKEWFILYEE